MTSYAFFEFLDRALHALAAEVPAAYARISELLSGRTLRVTVDGISRYVRVEESRHVLDLAGKETAELRTSRSVLVDLLEARRTLLDAVLFDDFVLRGGSADLAALHDALIAFIQGAVRSRTLPSLLHAYLEGDRSTSRSRGNAAERTHGSRKGDEIWQ